MYHFGFEGLYWKFARAMEIFTVQTACILVKFSILKKGNRDRRVTYLIIKDQKVHAVQLNLNLKYSRVNYTQHTSLRFVACLRVLRKVMTSPPLVESKHTCYKLVTSLST